MPKVKNILLLFFITCWSVFVFQFYSFREFTFFPDLLKSIVQCFSLITNPGLLFSYLWGIITLLAFILSSFGFGKLLLRALKIYSRQRGEHFILAVGLGIMVWVAIIFVCGSAGLLTPLYLKSIFWTTAVGTLIFNIRSFRSLALFTNVSVNKGRLSWLSRIGLLSIILVTSINFIAVLGPDIYFDTHMYHLALPQIFIQQKALVDIPANVFSYFPKNMGMLYVLALLVQGEMLARLMHFFFGLGAAHLLYLLGKKYFDRNIGIYAAAIFLLIPQVAMEMWSALNDLGVCFYLFLHLFCLAEWWKREGPEKNKFLYLSALFGGGALGIKYIVAPALIFSFLVLLFYYGRKKQWKSFFRQATVYCFIVGLMLAPWLLRNTLLRGEPLYPFVTLFGHSSDFQRASYLADCGFSGTGVTLCDFIFTPWLNVLEEGSLNSFTGPVFLFFLPLLVLLFRPKSRVVYFFLAYVIVYYIFWRMSTQGWRYFLAPLGIMGLMIGVVLGESKMATITKGVLSVLLVSMFIGNIGLTFQGLLARESIPVITGQQSVEYYLSKSHFMYPYPVFPAINYVNNSLPIQSKILFVGEVRGYGLQRHYSAHSPFETPLFEKLYKEAKNANELALLLKREQFTHIIFNQGEFVRLHGQYHNYQLTARDISLLKEFWPAYTKELFTHNGVSVLELCFP